MTDAPRSVIVLVGHKSGFFEGALTNAEISAGAEIPEDWNGQGGEHLPSAIFTFGFPPPRFLHADFVKRGDNICPRREGRPK